MGKKQGPKRDKRREKELARQQALREQRKQTAITTGIVAVILLLGGVLIWISLGEDDDPLADLLDDELEDLPDEEDNGDDTRDVACGADEPAAADEDKSTYEEPDDVLAEGVDYQAVVETSCGTVVIDLDAERAPETVNSFVFLASEGFFDGLEIFRNATGIGALQTGAGTNEASWDIGYTLDDELEAAEEDGYPPGTVAMANAGPDTAGSQFFFVYTDAFDDAFADDRAYARFGTVSEGLDVLTEIGEIEVGGPTGELPEQVVYLERVTIETDG